MQRLVNKWCHRFIGCVQEAVWSYRTTSHKAGVGGGFDQRTFKEMKLSKRVTKGHLGPLIPVRDHGNARHAYCQEMQTVTLSHGSLRQRIESFIPDRCSSCNRSDIFEILPIPGSDVHGPCKGNWHVLFYTDSASIGT